MLITPICSLRQLPRAPAKYAFVGFVDIRHVTWGRGAGVRRFWVKFFAKRENPTTVYPILRFRQLLQLPRASVGYRLHILSNSDDMAVGGGEGRKPKFPGHFLA